ncbi:MULTISPECIES: hypothetical protein [unclassified Microcoleus]|uniref:hypothetical protein n=1 Tax=unclassified Microcoleus TaxID=2642155 RepID=UPI0025DE7514|nr:MULTISPECIES: hypothetical protein [unclassified Microcoleus]
MYTENDRPPSLENLRAIAFLPNPANAGHDFPMIPTSKPKSHIHPWCIVRQLPNMQRLVVARFHRRGDAEGYIQILRRLVPATKHAIVFDTTGAEKLPDARTSEIERML